MSDKELLTADEGAQRLRIAKRTLLRWARENRTESVRLSRKVVLFAAELMEEGADLLKSRCLWMGSSVRLQ